jgi:hypothetical protein
MRKTKKLRNKKKFYLIFAGLIADLARRNPPLILVVEEVPESRGCQLARSFLFS